MGEFPPGSFAELEELPAGRFRNELGNLPPQAQQRAKAWLREMHFTSHDLHSMHADANGGVCFACNFQLPLMEEVENEVAPPNPTIPDRRQRRCRSRHFPKA